MSKILKLVFFVVLIPLLGALSTLFFEPIGFYNELNTPPLAPPGWLFGVAWTILYALLGWFLYNIIENKSQESIIIYIAQLVINFSWSFVFFNYKLFTVSFILIIIMFILTVWMFVINKHEKFKYILIPYMLWLIFASYLNLAIIILN